MGEQYLLIFNNGMTRLTDSQERAQSQIDLSVEKGRHYQVFYVKIDKSEADRLLEEDLTSLLE